MSNVHDNTIDDDNNDDDNLIDDDNNDKDTTSYYDFIKNFSNNDFSFYPPLMNTNSSLVTTDTAESTDLLFDFDFNTNIVFNTTKPNCYCNMPNICNECFTRFISKKTSHSTNSFVKTQSSNFIPPRLLKNFNDISHGIILDPDDMNTYHNLIIKTFFTETKRCGPFICKQPTILFTTYDQLPIGDYALVEQYINFKLWHYFINPVEDFILKALERKLQSYKFLCYHNDQCHHLSTYNQLIKNKIFHFISYDDYKTALHVCLYHPIFH